MTQTETPQFQTAHLLPRLTGEYGYTSQGALDIATKLVTADPSIKRIFWQWWETGYVDDSLAVEGYTAARLIATYGIKQPAAFSILDLLKRDPDLARAALNQKRERVAFREPSLR